RPRWGWAHVQVRRIVRLMLPILFGASVAQINLMLTTIIATFLAAGSVSWLYYADRLMEFPLGVFSIAIGTVILPNLSGHHAEDAAAAFSATLDWALRVLIVIGTPAMLALFVLAGPLVATLFQYGEFSAHDLRMTRYALCAYAFGFMGFSLVKVLLPGFFARHDSRTPVRYGVISVLAAMTLNFVFVGAALVLDWPAPHAGLAAATSVGAFVNAGLLYVGLRRTGIYHPGAGWVALYARVALACAVMALVLWWLAGDLAVWVTADAAQKALGLAGLVGAGLLAYFLSALVVGLRPRHLRGAA
ncbi:MAG: polysaccharide biosynthesis C-terminal domain-containing protein, partial [Salinisphaera sp.]|nr:polysaccharide biosynthesis C-terminal domain-containing protein [Salinisphaera sp.]